MFCVQRVRDELSDKSIRVIYEDSLPSTNDYALSMAATVAGKAVVIAARQTAGKGTRGRSFYSQNSGEGLYFSLLCHPGVPVAAAHLATPAAAVAVAGAIKDTTGVAAKIKWVNDIVIDDKKLCGILAENRLSQDRTAVETLVIGVGINLSVKRFPPDLRDTATALDRYTENIDAERLCAAALNRLDGYLEDLPARAFLADYRARSSLLGRTVRFVRDGAETEGTAADINADGNLVVETAAGPVVLQSGDVSVRPVSALP